MNEPRAKRITVGLALLLAVIMGLAAQLIVTLREQQRMSSDLAELNDAKYGLLNADVWLDQVSAIIEYKINTFEITPQNRAAIKRSLVRMLDVLITEADRYMRMQTKRESQTGGWWKRAKGKVKLTVQDRLVNVDEIKRGIPQYADKILSAMQKPAAREEIKDFLKQMLARVSDSTFALVDQSELEAIQARYQCSDRSTCHPAIDAAVKSNHQRAMQLTVAVLLLTALLFALAALTPGAKQPDRLALLSLCCAMLMLCGVLTPMIEIEARISELRFILLEQPVEFTNQVLYFQSKSVLDVVEILTRTGKIDMIIVGILIMTFSVIFPLAKLLASFIYLYDYRGLRRSAVTHFFALKSGKWSMADVFVVAMFMTYIGFNGIIASQLSKFSRAGGDSVDILTTNGTSLQIGFFMFLAFCLASLLTSTLMDTAIKSDTPVPDQGAQNSASASGV